LKPWDWKKFGQDKYREEESWENSSNPEWEKKEKIIIFKTLNKHLGNKSFRNVLVYLRVYILDLRKWFSHFSSSYLNFIIMDWPHWFEIIPI
jgi:hypothetical protein